MLLHRDLAFGRRPAPIYSDTATHLDTVPASHSDSDGDDPLDGHTRTPFFDSQVGSQRYFYFYPDANACLYTDGQPDTNADEYPDPDRN